MIEIKGLSKSFGEEKVLNDINVQIEDGDIFGLVGRSGVGKSTLLRCINGLESYDEGSLTVHGQEVKDLKGMDLRKFRKNVGMIFQQFSLTERDTVYDNVALPMKCWKYDKKEIDEKVNRLLEIVELSDRKDQKTRSLSGGQKQRVAIARALTMDPSVLLCDEATSALDPNTTLSILELLKKINKELGVTIVVVTHEMSVVRAVCKHLAVLDRSGVADIGSVEEVFKNQCDALQDLLGSKLNDYSIVEDGQILRVFYSSNTTARDILSRITKETGVTYDILSASQEDYETGTFGEYVIHVRDGREKELTDYLDGQKVFWEVLN